MKNMWILIAVLSSLVACAVAAHIAARATADGPTRAEMRGLWVVETYHGTEVTGQWVCNGPQDLDARSVEIPGTNWRASEESFVDAYGTSHTGTLGVGDSIGQYPLEAK